MMSELLARIRIGYPQEVESFLEDAPIVVVQKIRELLRTPGLYQSYFFGAQLTASFVCLLPTLRREMVRLLRESALQAQNLDDVLDRIADYFFDVQTIQNMLSEIRDMSW